MRLGKVFRAAVAITLAVIVVITACYGISKLGAWRAVKLYGNGSTSSEAILNNPNQPVKLKLGIWESKTDIEYWTEKVKAYSLERPYVTVEVETIPDNSGQYLKTRLASNDLPDLFYLKSVHLPVYKASLLPLEGMRATMENRFPAVLDDHVLGLPLVSFSEYVYYHPSLFEEIGVKVPTTRDEFITVLERIKDHGQYIPIAIGGKEAWTFYPFIEFGPPLIADDEYYLTFLTTQKEPFGRFSAFDQAANMIELIANRSLAGPNTLEIGFDEAKNLFQTKKAAMIALGQWYYSDYMSKVGDDSDLNAFAMPWRTSVDQPLKAVTMPDHYMVINKYSKNKQEAVDFLEWMFSEEVYLSYIDYTQNSPTLHNVTAVLPFFNRVNQYHPFEPFIYYGLDERFVQLKNMSQYDEKAMAQEIFAGAAIEDVEQKMNESWRKAQE